MIIGLPRSGTTWAANWLTSDRSLCVHDPLHVNHYQDWDRVNWGSPAGHKNGVSCSGIWRWPAWVNAHPAKKLILHRDIAQVERSLSRIGLGGLVKPGDVTALSQFKGMHVDWSELFDPQRAQVMWEYLIGDGFSASRHYHLRQMKIEPKFDSLHIDMELQHRLYAELGEGNVAWPG